MRENGHGLPAIPTRAELEAAGLRIVVGVPMERTVPQEAFHSFWAIAQKGWPLMELRYQRTDVARNLMAKALLNSDFTHLMMLDLDHLHPPDVVERHARWALADPERLVVAGLHFRRGEPFDPLAFVFGADGGLHPIAEWQPGLFQAHAVGHGSLLVHRSVFERTPAPWWAYDYAQADDWRFPSEDMYFCYQCRAAGIALWCDTTTSSPHLIQQAVTEDTFRDWMARHPDKITHIERG